MEKTFEERIRTIGRDAVNYLYDTLIDAKPIILETENDDIDRLYVNAFDFYGKPYETVVKVIDACHIEDWNGEEIKYGKLTNQSCARIADYVTEHLKTKEE